MVWKCRQPGSERTMRSGGIAFRAWLAAAVCIAMGVSYPAASHADEAVAPLRFGVVPQQAARKLARLWTPLLEVVSEQVGISIVFETAPDIPTFERRLKEGQYHLAYMNPYHYTVFHRNPGYIALAKQADKRIRGILVTRKDETLPSGKLTLAFPAPAAFAATILTRAKLQQHGIEFESRYVKSHDSVYRSVALGLYPAGGGVMRTFNNLDPAVRDQLQILWETEGFTPHAVAAHPALPTHTFNAVRAGFVALNDSQEGRRALAGLSLRAFESASDSDWDDVRSLNIGLLEEADKD